jgi:galactokinase
MYPDIVISTFREKFGHAPQIVVRAPGRINLIGEHTDYNGGFVLPAAIDKAIWFAASPRTDRQLVLHALDLHQDCAVSMDKIATQPTQSWANYLLGVVDELQKSNATLGGISLVFGGNVPLGAGLSSSAAVENGMGFVLNQLYALGMERMDMVRLSQRAENNFVGMQCGIMDMFASMMGKADHVVRLDCQSLDYQYFPFSGAEHAIVLCNSGVKHALVDSEYNTRRQECEEGVAVLAKYYPNITLLRHTTLQQLEAHAAQMSPTVLMRCRYVVEEIERVEKACVALQHHDLGTFGKLMYRTHEGLSKEYGVSCPELDFLVEATRDYNALHTGTQPVLGARIMGGGFGGCSINLVHKNYLSDFTQAIQRAYHDAYQRDLPCHIVQLTAGVEMATVARTNTVKVPT